MAGPGVITTFGVRGGGSGGTGVGSGRYFVAGLFETGPTDAPVRVRNMRELEDNFGARAAYSSAYDSLRCFFGEGGAEAYVLRVAGPAATKGTLTLKDGAGVPVDTLRVDAVGPGAGSAGTTVEVLVGAPVDTAKVVVRTGDEVETYTGVSSADIAARMSGSKRVRGVNLGGGLPAPVAATALSAGADDRATVTAATVTGSLDKFASSLGTGAVATPGYSADLVAAALIAHAKLTRRVAILAPPVDSSTGDLVTLASSLIGGDGQYALLAAPWVTINVGPGITLVTSPEGFVAGVRARAHAASGPWSAAAGMSSAARSLVGVEREIGQDEGSTLNAAGVSVIRTLVGRTVLYGYRSLAADRDNYALVSAQDTLNWLAQACEDALLPFVFAPIDGNGGLLGQVEGVLRGICEGARSGGGLFAKYEGEAPRSMVDPGYSVDVGDSVNTAASLAQNVLRARVAVRLSPHAELVELTIIKVSLSAAV